MHSAAREMASVGTYNSPCAACKFLRRKCIPSCVLAPYFPQEEPLKFVNVHKIFGASNVTKLLNEVLPHQREDAVNSLAYEAEARIRDPVYGCVGAIAYLQRQIQRLQKELDAANADLLRLLYNDLASGFPQPAINGYPTRITGDPPQASFYLPASGVPVSFIPYTFPHSSSNGVSRGPDMNL